MVAAMQISAIQPMSATKATVDHDMDASEEGALPTVSSIAHKMAMPSNKHAASTWMVANHAVDRIEPPAIMEVVTDQPLSNTPSIDSEWTTDWGTALN